MFQTSFRCKNLNGKINADAIPIISICAIIELQHAGATN